jgi:uncharacterized protein
MSYRRMPGSSPIDTTGFIAVPDMNDACHAGAVRTWLEILTSEETLVSSNSVLMEIRALVQDRLGLKAVKMFHEDIVPFLQIEWIAE